MNTVYVTATNGTINLGASFFKSLAPDTTVIIPNGTYDAAKIIVPAGVQGISIKPASEDGVTFTGKTAIVLEGNTTTITGFTFDHTREDTVEITGDGNTLSNNHFIGTGNPSNTQDAVIWIDPKAQNTHFVGNEVEASVSMTIKVRADVYGSKEQPTGTVIENNYFHDIKALSANGQEVIQIAGPGGQWIEGHDLELGTLIKNNVFYKTEGDVETISMKVGGTTVTGNVFMSMDAAPTVRNGGHNTIDSNILIDTRPIRVMGDSTEITNNVIINPKDTAFILANGTSRYQVAEGNTISNNIIYSDTDISVFKVVNQTSGAVTQIHDNVVTDNAYMVTDTSKLYNFTATGVTASKYFTENNFGAGESVSDNVAQWIQKLIAQSDDPQALLSSYLGKDGLDIAALLNNVVTISFHEFSETDIITSGTNSKIAGTISADRINGGNVSDLINAGAGDDNVKAGKGNDVVFGEAGNDFLQGNDGHDALAGGVGDDKLHGHTGNDTLLGGAGNDILRGNEGDDLVVGGAGNDTVMGHEGNDILSGSAGTDVLTGGAGADIFAFSTTGNDNIRDFTASEGDSIDLSALVSGYNASTHSITDFVSISIDGNQATISVDANGGANNFVHVADARLTETITLETLLEHIILD